jgi:hypothetical protein
LGKTKSTWDTDEGLPDDFDFTIEKASFGYRQEYKDGEVLLLIWEGTSPDSETESIIFPCGKGWEAEKKGAVAVHEKRERFVKSSLTGRLIDRVVKELGVDMSDRGEATEAKVWDGITFHMRREEISFGPGILDDKGGKISHLMPVAVVAGVKGKKAKVSKKTKDEDAEEEEAPKKKAKDADEETAGLEIDKDLDKKLGKWAGTMSKEVFQKKAMDLDEVTDNPELMEHVLEDGKTGYWAKHQE